MKPIEIPAIELAASVSAVAAPTAEEGTVLLVDDDAIVRMLTAAGLAERGWRVIEADGGARALQLFAQERPHVVALDGTAAGDAFTACLVVSLLEGREPEEALRRACAAGALAASRFGAQPSLPTAAEVDAILRA